MRFLIDECLHTTLVTVAHDAGYTCNHVNFLGLGGCKDWQLIARIRDEEYAFVTNNGADFKALYGREVVHAGLIIIIPNVIPSRQRELFKAALAHLRGRDLINTVLEVDLTRSAAVCREYSFPT